jgi:hypothetical protein
MALSAFKQHGHASRMMPLIQVVLLDLIPDAGKCGALRNFSVDLLFEFRATAVLNPAHYRLNV